MFVAVSIVSLIFLLPHAVSGGPQKQLTVAIDPAIEQALQENPTVPVLISLAAPSSVSLVDATLADVQQNVARRTA